MAQQVALPNQVASPPQSTLDKWTPEQITAMLSREPIKMNRLTGRSNTAKLLADLKEASDGILNYENSRPRYTHPSQDSIREAMSRSQYKEMIGIEDYIGGGKITKVFLDDFENDNGHDDMVDAMKMQTKALGQWHDSICNDIKKSDYPLEEA